MEPRKLRYIDMDQVNEDIEAGRFEDDGRPGVDVLTDTILDLLQIAGDEGLTEDEIDSVIHRVVDYQAQRKRARFRLRTGGDD